MEYRTLGRTGLRVSAVALGCEGFMHKRAEEVKADFDFAIGHGINFVDIYSSNPDLRADIGAALEGRRGEIIIQGDHRDRVVEILAKGGYRCKKAGS